jgi:hypothetical protein
MSKPKHISQAERTEELALKAKPTKANVSDLQEMLQMLRKAKKYLLKEMHELEEGEQTVERQIAEIGMKEGTVDKYIQAQLSASTELLRNINHRKKCERHRIMMQAPISSTAKRAGTAATAAHTQ